jgi:hypothetical protein
VVSLGESALWRDYSPHAGLPFNCLRLGRPAEPAPFSGDRG